MQPNGHLAWLEGNHEIFTQKDKGKIHAITGQEGPSGGVEA
jgi:hypothetical protein